MQKPKNLYHASSEKNIEEFEPRNNSPRYSGEVDLVFATPHQELAAMFLAPRDIPNEMSIYGGTYVLFSESDEAAYRALDKGGAIYRLPTETFETDLVHGMKDIEWCSRVPVKPMSKKVYKSSREALDAFGVKHYFVDHQTMEKIRANPGDALKLVE